MGKYEYFVLTQLQLDLKFKLRRDSRRLLELTKLTNADWTPL